ncbi:endonuclease/exonuclease/phosphatase family protein [Haliea sp. E1-2-M8]|uniref:endonuclease/exonuclease/phosphatase family protein n=1 Tax=Haliea sp. E1-2-M8 TaxID=3064706 RepID=UPI0027272812|nr:endonuclease/exonuclease/phosphatase family protein [Haliea sp. E1-2-M8]MDO8860579.1 endonuclease/exonuclease/phosphatase family protein [Haliea sp. E1-2-M8]
MLGRLESLYRRLRRSFSRSVWLARLLRLPDSAGPATRPGLVMIQIDGLSQQQFERALERGEMPFLRRLLRREHYRVHAHYSGLPSTTPAVQAELFYGVAAAVPAFSYRDRTSSAIVRMYEPEVAAQVEARLAAEGGEALLRGGSAYSNNYTGGAAESHFCASSMGWGSTLRAANPLVMMAFLLANFYSFARVGVLLLLELALALRDFGQGLVRGHGLLAELKFIPTRVGISILLRELCVIGGKIDISRGLPVIHMNLLGYDEQAHRRGPESLFAHWTLKGIDDAVARLWRAAAHAPWRQYEIWVYSDHGQALVRPYAELQGSTLAEAVSAAFATSSGAPLRTHIDGVAGEQTQRVRLLGGTRIQRLFAVMGLDGGEHEEPHPMVAALGPIAHVYAPSEVSKAERDRIAHTLAKTCRVPVVITVQAPGQLRAHTATGDFRLPGDEGALFGTQHPFLPSIAEDLVHMCQHPDAGDLVLLGWRQGLEPVSFAAENGAHGGAMPAETNGFALLPIDTPLPQRDRNYLRPRELRNAALRYLGRAERGAAPVPRPSSSARTDTLRVMTYNVHSCVGMDGKLDVERIARVIARGRPDVVALQELDVGRSRTDGMDQAHLIARYLEMEFHFHPALHLEEELYGDAILTHLPQRLIKAGALPGLADRASLEPRGALWVALELDGVEVQFINTHLGLHPRERMAQVQALLGNEWLAHEQCLGPVILCGDFNALPSSPVCRQISGRLVDAQAQAPGQPRGTFSGRFPAVRIDHIFVSAELEVTGIEVPASALARAASDHLPLLAEIRFSGQGRRT